MKSKETAIHQTKKTSAAQMPAVATHLTTRFMPHATASDTISTGNANIGPSTYSQRSLLTGLDGKVMKSKKTAIHQTKKTSAAQMPAVATHLTTRFMPQGYR